jgi:hypothetical protein
MYKNRPLGRRQQRMDNSQLETAGRAS